ncbi:F-box domain protein [Trichostrongylus colubriformis]|uniref:F-box domain protein n=1 Tax=Trichostrongylus colubriformis TaxID=6319 RepID=A0AAN8G8C2_TRICO
MDIPPHRSRRCVGAHLRAYGSSRLSIGDLDRDTSQNIQKKETQIRAQTYWSRIWQKFCDFLVAILQFCFPALFRFLYAPCTPTFKKNQFPSFSELKSTCIPYSPIHQFPNALLTRIFGFLSCKSLLSCELTCKRWRTVIERNLDTLPKIPTDQIRILFDEAEVIIYPLDARKCPVRYDMPSLKALERRLRHLTTQSLFIRGLIPVESSPVLRSLLSLALRPQQIYFIWSKFSPASMPMLEKFFRANRDTVVDIGIEECSPPNLFNDELLESLLPGLTCVRLWNNGKEGNYAVSDATIYKLADAITDGYPVETVDLASCGLTEASLSALILAWSRQPQSDLCISLNYCPVLNKISLLESLASHDIFLTDGKLRRKGYSLTLFC